jgi:hypothetical protein
MSVGTFDPNATENSFDIELARELLDLFDGEDITLGKSGQLRYGILARHAGWAGAMDRFLDEEVIGLAKIFTLLEHQYTTFQAGSDSPVIAMVQALKVRNQWDKPLTQWIKSHTDNRFLPHGSLMDRL